MMFTVLDFLQKIVPTSAMQSVISQGESVEMLLVLHWTTIFCMNDGSGKLMAGQSTFSTRSPPMHKFTAFSDTQYFFHIIWYRANPAMMESPNRNVLGFVTCETVVAMKLDPVRFIKTPSCIQSYQKYSQK